MQHLYVQKYLCWILWVDIAISFLGMTKTNKVLMKKCSKLGSFFYYHLASINLSASMYFKIFGYLDHQGKWWLGMIYDAIILKRVRVVLERFCADSLLCRSVGESFSWYNNTILLCNYFNFITIPKKKRRIPQEP